MNKQLAVFLFYFILLFVFFVFCFFFVFVLFCFVCFATTRVIKGKPNDEVNFTGLQQTDRTGN